MKVMIEDSNYKQGYYDGLDKMVHYVLEVIEEQKTYASLEDIENYIKDNL